MAPWLQTGDHTWRRTGLDLAGLQAVGHTLGRHGRAGDVLLLAGDLGAGKTTLTQAVARGLAVPASYPVTSPTFALLHAYPGRLPLYHLDLYRLAGEEELVDLGLDEYLESDGVAVVEWPDRLGTLQPARHLALTLLLEDLHHRTLELTASGPHWQELLAALLALP